MAMKMGFGGPTLPVQPERRRPQMFRRAPAPGVNMGPVGRPGGGGMRMPPLGQDQVSQIRMALERKFQAENPAPAGPSAPGIQGQPPIGRAGAPPPPSLAPEMMATRTPSMPSPPVSEPMTSSVMAPVGPPDGDADDPRRMVKFGGSEDPLKPQY